MFRKRSLVYRCKSFHEKKKKTKAIRLLTGKRYLQSKERVPERSILERNCTMVEILLLGSS